MIRKSLLMLCLLAVPAIALARPAQGPGRQDDSGMMDETMGPGNHRPGHQVPPMQLRSLKDPQCLKDCRDERQDCGIAARENAAPCIEACQPLADAARDACSEDPGSTECREAHEAFRDCVQPCREALQPELVQCAEAVRDCIAVCPVIQDLECLDECKDAKRTCMADAWTELRSCFDQCEPELDAARDACVQDPRSESCKEARDAAHACLQPCNEAARLAVEECGDTFRQCVTPCATDLTE